MDVQNFKLFARARVEFKIRIGPLSLEIGLRTALWLGLRVVLGLRLEGGARARARGWCYG